MRNTPFGLGMLSLGIALVVWVLVTNSENPVDSRSVEVRLEAVNLPRGYVASGIAPEKVTVGLFGPRNVLREMRTDEIVARVDLAGTEQDTSGQAEFSIYRPVRADLRGRRDRRVRAEPSIEQAKVTLERLERKEVPVRVSRVGVPPVGYEAEPGSPEPARAMVEGTPRNLSAVEAISADVKLDGLTVTVSQTVPLEARDGAGHTVGRVNVQPGTAIVKVAVKQNFYPKQVGVVVQTRGHPKTGFQVASVRPDPAAVTVVGPLDQINNLTGVLTDAIELEGADRDLTRSVRLQLPSGVTSSQQSVVVSVGVQVVRAAGSQPAVPRVVNLAPGLTVVQTAPPIVALNLSGPLGDLNQLRPTDVSVTVDVAALGPGTHRLEPKVLYPPTLQLDAVVPDKVEVVIAPAR